jgi:hypothetical protein
LRRQSDFGHQHQRLLAARQALRDGLQIDLGLAAAGDAIEQERHEAVGGVDRGHRRCLLLVRHRPGQRMGRQLRCGHGDAFGQAALRQRARCSAPAFDLRIQRVFIARLRLQPLGQPARPAAVAQAWQLRGAVRRQLPSP